jgi:hypothetical protein
MGCRDSPSVLLEAVEADLKVTRCGVKLVHWLSLTEATPPSPDSSPAVEVQLRQFTSFKPPAVPSIKVCVHVLPGTATAVFCSVTLMAASSVPSVSVPQFVATLTSSILW